MFSGLGVGKFLRVYGELGKDRLGRRKDIGLGPRTIRDGGLQNGSSISTDPFHAQRERFSDGHDSIAGAIKPETWNSRFDGLE